MASNNKPFAPWHISLLLVATTLTFGQKPERYNLRPAECDAYDKIEVLAKDLPTAEERKALASCSSEDLYFGFAVAADPVKARKCAYIEREKAGEVQQTAFSGSALLSMIYANGKGADRNFDLATKFSCEVDGAPAENARRFQHLQKLKAGNWSGDNFHLCDDITSGYMEGMCAGLEEKFASVARNKKLNNITAHWSSAERSAFHDLREEAQAFFKASSRNEVDLSGTARGQLVVEAEASLNDEFVAAVDRFERGELPRFTTADFSKADAKLNLEYAKLQLKPNKPIGFSTVTPAGVKTAQRTWLRYREAWVKFGQIKYPSVSPESWRTWLTEQRISMLSGLLEME